jgi:hypothetical protein
MPEPMIETIIVGSNQQQETTKNLEVQRDMGKPYFYHTAPVERLRQIFEDGKLKDPEGKPIMFTADQVGDDGQILSNGLTDGSNEYLSGRKFEPGRLIFVFDKRVVENPNFSPISSDRRYPQVQEQPISKAVAIITFKEDMPGIWQSMKATGTDIPIVTKTDWESYAYGVTDGLAVLDEDKEEVTGGLADPDFKVNESVLDQDKASVVEQINSRPEDLLTMETIGVEEFFGLDFEKVYAKLHPLGSLAGDNPDRRRWMKIKETWENGKAVFLEENPGLEKINLV